MNLDDERANMLFKLFIKKILIIILIFTLWVIYQH